MEEKKTGEVKKADEAKVEDQSEQCLHLNVEKEYFNGTHTGDYICKDCGKTFWEHRP